MARYFVIICDVHCPHGKVWAWDNESCRYSAGDRRHTPDGSKRTRWRVTAFSKTNVWCKCRAPKRGPRVEGDPS